jgi:hypothetical protein
MKVEKKQIASTFLAPYWNLIIKTANLIKKTLSKSGKFGSFFSIRNPLCRLKPYFQRNMGVQALLTFNKQGFLSLMRYVFIGQ